jgi:gamma-glutamylcyclotransferase (GGCT)/AIG2-like uncharacterized protein YtfP
MEKQKMVNTNLYAVYGTLRQGFGNYERLLNNTKCHYLGKERTKPEFTMVSLGGFPGVIPGGDQSVLVEVFRVESPAIEKSLDYLEGYPSFYGKTQIETQWGIANMYTLDDTYLERRHVPSGDWAEFIGKKSL